MGETRSRTVKLGFSKEMDWKNRSYLIIEDSWSQSIQSL